nr:MAG TPA: hypothetical protein [Caudoviricetes sp.]
MMKNGQICWRQLVITKTKQRGFVKVNGRKKTVVPFALKQTEMEIRRNKNEENNCERKDLGDNQGLRRS